MDTIPEEQFDQIADVKETDQTNEVEIRDRVARHARRGWFQRILDWFYGYDYFISYRWSDGRVYAVALAEQLEQQGFDCFLDSEDYAKGDNWKRIGEWALKKTSRLVLVGSPHAVHPDPPREPGKDPVLREVKKFTATGKRVIPINFDGTLTFGENDDPPLTRCLDQDGLWIQESTAQLAIGPSETTLNELRNSFNLVRQSEKRSRILRILIAVFAALSVTATVAAVVAFISYHLAEERRVDAEAKSRIATAQRLAVQADAARIIEPPYPQRSLLLAVEAIRATRDYGQPVVPAAEQALHDAFAAVHGKFIADHKAKVESIKFGPSGRLLTFGEDRTVKVWDRTNGSGKPLVIGTGRDLIYTAMFAPDGRLVTGGFDGLIKIWDLDRPASAPITLPGHTGSVTGLAFTLDDRLVSVSQDGTARVWNLDGTKSAVDALRLQGRNKIGALAVAPDGRIFVGDEDHNISAWDLTDLKTDPLILVGHSNWIDTLKFTDDGRLVSLSADGTIRVWNLDNPAEPEVLRVPFGDSENDSIAKFVLGPNNQLAAICDSRTVNFDQPVTYPTVRIWNLNEPWDAPSIFRGQKGLIFAVAFAPDGRLVTGGQDRLIRVWDLQRPNAQPQILSGHEGSVNCFAFGPDGMLFSGSSGGTVRVWDLNNASCLPVVLRGHDRDIESIAVAPDGRVVTGGFDRTLRIWDVNNAQSTPLVLRGHKGWVTAIAFAPDGRMVTGGGYGDNSVRLWNLSNPEEQARLLGQHEFLATLAFAPDGRLVTGGYGLRIWDLNDTTAKPAKMGEYAGIIKAMAFAPDGRLFTGGEDLRVWDFMTPKSTPSVFDGHIGSHINALAFTESGQLVTGGSGGTIRIWNIKNLQHSIMELPAPSEVNDLAFDVRGRLVSSGSDGRVCFWKLSSSTHAPELVLRRDDWTIDSMALTSDNKLVTGNLKGLLRVWDLDVDRLSTLAGQVAGRNLSVMEWQQFVNEDKHRYRKTFRDVANGEGVGR